MCLSTLRVKLRNPIASINRPEMIDAVAISCSTANPDLVYGFSNSTIYPSLAVTGQLTSDPLDSLGQPLTIKLGSANDTSGRYGDYFGAGVDPFDPGTVWVAGEYHTTVHWLLRSYRVLLVNVHS